MCTDAVARGRPPGAAAFASNTSTWLGFKRTLRRQEVTTSITAEVCKNMDPEVEVFALEHIVSDKREPSQHSPTAGAAIRMPAALAVAADSCSGSESQPMNAPVCVAFYESNDFAHARLLGHAVAISSFS